MAFVARKLACACIHDLRDGNRCSVPGGRGRRKRKGRVRGDNCSFDRACRRPDSLSVPSSWTPAITTTIIIIIYYIRIWRYYVSADFVTAFILEVQSGGGYKGCIYRVSNNALDLGTTALYCRVRGRPRQRNPIDRTLRRETDRTKRRVTPVSRFASALIITALCRRPVPDRKDDKSAPAPVAPDSHRRNWHDPRKPLVYEQTVCCLFADWEI